MHNIILVIIDFSSITIKFVYFNFFNVELGSMIVVKYLLIDIKNTKCIVSACGDNHKTTLVVTKRNTFFPSN
jgi:hypothetical protein